MMLIVQCLTSILWQWLLNGYSLFPIGWEGLCGETMSIRRGLNKEYVCVHCVSESVGCSWNENHVYECLSVYFARLMVQETYANERRCCTRLHCIRRGVQEIKKARKRTITDHGYNWQKANDPFKDVERVTATLWYMHITSIAGMTADENRIIPLFMCARVVHLKRKERWKDGESSSRNIPTLFKRGKKHEKRSSCGSVGQGCMKRIVTYNCPLYWSLFLVLHMQKCT